MLERRNFCVLCAAMLNETAHALKKFIELGWNRIGLESDYSPSVSSSVEGLSCQLSFELLMLNGGFDAKDALAPEVPRYTSTHRTAGSMAIQCTETE